MIENKTFNAKPMDRLVNAMFIVCYPVACIRCLSVLFHCACGDRANEADRDELTIAIQSPYMFFLPLLAFPSFHSISTAVIPVPLHPSLLYTLVPS